MRGVLSNRGAFFLCRGLGLGGGGWGGCGSEARDQEFHERARIGIRGFQLAIGVGEGHKTGEEIGFRDAMRVADCGFRIARTHSQVARGLIAVHCARQAAGFDEFAVAKCERADEAYRLFTLAQEIIEKFESFGSLL